MHERWRNDYDYQPHRWLPDCGFWHSSRDGANPAGDGSTPPGLLHRRGVFERRCVIAIGETA